MNRPLLVKPRTVPFGLLPAATRLARLFAPSIGTALLYD
jgi:hypothetical protein